MKPKINFMMKLSVTILLLSSCATPSFNRALLNPTSGILNPKLPRLDMVRTDLQGMTGKDRLITSNSKMYTLFERELPNICDQNGTVKGDIEPVIILNDLSENLTPVIVSSLILWIPQLLGAPMGSDKYQLEVEFVLRNSDKKVIWKKSYYEEDKQTYGFYYGTDKRGDERTLILYRKMIQDFKNDLQDDIESILQNF